jgi:hypothetical protein
VILIQNILIWRKQMICSVRNNNNVGQVNFEVFCIQAFNLVAYTKGLFQSFPFSRIFDGQQENLAAMGDYSGDMRYIAYAQVLW